MDKFTKTLKTKYTKLLDSGRDNATFRDLFIWEKMKHDLPCADESCTAAPRPTDIYFHLIEDDTIDNDAFCLERTKKLFHVTERLTVQLSPLHQLVLEPTSTSLSISLNNDSTARPVRISEASDIAAWIVHQKSNFDTYLAEWESILCDVAKKAKTRRLVVQAVKALATEALRPYPNVTFEVFEQSRRVKLMVRFLNSNLGLNIYAYYGSYKKTLPPQLEDLKRITEVLSHNVHKTFFTYST